MIYLKTTCSVLLVHLFLPLSLLLLQTPLAVSLFADQGIEPLLNIRVQTIIGFFHHVERLLDLLHVNSEVLDIVPKLAHFTGPDPLSAPHQLIDQILNISKSSKHVDRDLADVPEQVVEVGSTIDCLVI